MSLANARQALLDARTDGGWWEGELSSSALSTATAVFAIHLFLESSELAPFHVPPAPISSELETTCHRLIAEGLAWLALHQNADGGWGDTVFSKSNISTTALCWAAMADDARRANPRHANVAAAAELWLTRHAGGCDPARLVPAIIARYGKDKTFSVPILTMCALARRLGSGRAAWKHVPQLPFELAAFPQRGFKWLRLPVVSYALPALIAIGQARHAHRPSRNPILRALRRLTRARTLALLARIQPSSGGFLEAAPLTSFVVMSLSGAGQSLHPVARRGVEFLIRSARPDGSWPIDTNLATWVTTLSVNALATHPDFPNILSEQERQAIASWLLPQQYTQEHPYTLADPGAWAWTPLSGGVPDADDTPGALLALWNLGCRAVRADGSGRDPSDGRTSETLERNNADAPEAFRDVHAGAERRANDADHARVLTPRRPGLGALFRSLRFAIARPIRGGTRSAPAWTLNALSSRSRRRSQDYGAMGKRGVQEDATSRECGAIARAARMGCTWLLNLQNRDGGVPTFCRGWGRLPFDRSSADLTAHAIRALLSWSVQLPELRERIDHFIARAIEFLLRAQRADGAWTPLWFGNQHAPGDENPTYGTARVLCVGSILGQSFSHSWNDARLRGIKWLLGAQNADGGWGGDRGTPSSIEETALAVEALAKAVACMLDRASEISDMSVKASVDRATAWLIEQTDGGRSFPPTPIGFYFAKLWYFEKLYPLIFTVAALSAFEAALFPDPSAHEAREAGTMKM